MHNDPSLFQRYTVIDGPESIRLHRLSDECDGKWKSYTNPTDGSDLVSTDKPIYRSWSTFLATPMKYSVWLYSSPDGYEHAFQEVIEARGDEFARVYNSFVFCHSDRQIPSGTFR